MKKKLKLKLKVVATCKGGPCPCPTIYRSEDGRLFVQGYKVAHEIEAQVNPPSGEGLVEVPKELLEMFSKK